MPVIHARMIIPTKQAIGKSSDSRKNCLSASWTYRMLLVPPVDEPSRAVVDVIRLTELLGGFSSERAFLCYAVF